MRRDKKNNLKDRNDCADKHSRLMAITVKAVVINRSGKVLLLKRAEDEITNKNLWDLPGGGIEAGETIEEALVREVREETGFEVALGNLIKVSEFDKSHSCFLAEKRGLRFIVRYDGGDDKPILSQKEHNEFGWFEIDEAIEKFDFQNGFENEKRETVLEAKKMLEWQKADDNYKRLLADFENYKRRTAKNNEDFKKYCIEDFVLDILPVLDNFEMAIEHAPDNDKDKPWMMGIIHIHSQLKKILEDRGVSEISVKIGDPVDATLHEVVANTKNEELNPGVTKILKKGYQLGGKVVRPISVEAKN